MKRHMSKTANDWCQIVVHGQRPLNISLINGHYMNGQGISKLTNKRVMKDLEWLRRKGWKLAREGTKGFQQCNFTGN